MAEPFPGIPRNPGGGRGERSPDPPEKTSAPLPGAGEGRPEVGAPQRDPRRSGGVTPEKIGRFLIRALLGRGGFGRVYLAYDPQLDRPVAIKVPAAERFPSERERVRYIEEARIAARLNHPRVVAVYDVSRDGETIFIVLEYIDGESLATAMRSRRFDPLRAAALMTEIADGVAHAHEHGLIHRDLKPANILLDADGRPHIADFGLAIRERAGLLPEGEAAGTPPYMAPEQIRGETHRLDARTDIWSLGVVFYELLTGCRPFAGSDRAELFRRILESEPPRAQTLGGPLPEPLERICLKCLSKRMSDRYASAAELAFELRAWQDHGQAATVAEGPAIRESRPATVVPKGLRAFDENDAEFFLELLPGPFDREGLPESIRFWKTRVEQLDPDKTFAVGLFYGPSGSGKSSLVRAGLIPRLASHVRPIYIEASANETERGIRRALRRQCRSLSIDASLAQAIVAIREEELLPEGHKIVVFIDQFEQWLHARRAEPNPELVQALRHCDGRTVQAVVMVRDDFGMSAMRFMGALEVPVVEGHNYATFDRFDVPHAVKVLASFGRAFGLLAAEEPPQAEQQRFLARAVEGLAEEGKVVPVRLALFAEMFRGKHWDVAALRKVGGAEGTGVTFLEEMLGHAAANPHRRLHQEAARRVLRALLPERGTDIRGHLIPQSQLLEVSGYAARPRDFEELLRILDGELRLITPGEPRSASGESESVDSVSRIEPAQRSYQLTHDYLVPSLRDWLTRREQETIRGRASLLLERRADLWSARPEKRYLPSLAEWARLALLTRKSQRTEPQRKMMSAATRTHLARLLWAAALLVAILTVGWALWAGIERQRRAAEGRSLVSQLRVAEWSRLPNVLAQLRRQPESWWDEVAGIAGDASRPPDERLRARVALAQLDEAGVPALVDDLLSASPQQLRVICGAMEPWRDRAGPLLWSKLRDAATGAEGRLRAACALAASDPANPDWTEAAPAVAEALSGEKDPLYVAAWIEWLRPVASRLLGPLGAVYGDPARSDAQRMVATGVLAELGEGDPERLASLILDADDRQHAVLFRVLSKDATQTSLRMRRALETPRTGATPDEKDRHARRQLNAACTLARLGQWAPVWPLLKSSPDPWVRTLLIHRMAAYEVPAASLRQGLEAEEPDVRQAVLLALGEYPAGSLAANERSAFVEASRRLYVADPDSGVHAGAEWLLRKWGRQADLQELQRRLAGTRRPGWRVNGQGQTMVVLRGPVTFTMGSPQSEPQRDEMETQHLRVIDRSFEVSSHEVTIEQFRRFHADAPYAADVAAQPDCPINRVAWYDAAAYCRWLTEQEGIAEDQQCYPDKIGPGMALPADYLSRTGYRLPTEAEWEYACRAGTGTTRFYGDSDAMLAEYGWYTANCEDRLWPVGTRKPNPFGLFDTYGNVMEWCQNLMTTIPAAVGDHVVRDDSARSESGASRALRGGGYRYTARDTRSAKRFGLSPSASWSGLGFRVARTLRE